MKRLFFLLILPFILLTPCQGSSQSMEEDDQNEEKNSLTYLTNNKFVLEFVRANAPSAQTLEEALEVIYASQVAQDPPCDDALCDFMTQWLVHSRCFSQFSREVQAQDISRPLQQKIFKIAKAQEILRSAIKAQQDTWEKGLAPQTQSAFVPAFVAAYPEALPQNFDEFPGAMGIPIFRQWGMSLVPYALIRSTFGESLKGLESARHLVREECGLERFDATTPEMKVKGMEEVSALQDLRSLFLHRASRFLAKTHDPWPLLETLGTVLPSLTHLETLQLPVLFAHEEAQARALLASCTHLKQVILSRFLQGDGAPLGTPVLDPETLFGAVPEGVEKFIREEGTNDTGLMSIVPAHGGIYPYTADGKSPERAAPYVENFYSWGLYCALMEMVKKELGDA